MGDCSLSNTDVSILIFYIFFCCLAVLSTYKEPSTLRSDRAYLLMERKTVIKQQTEFRMMNPDQRFGPSSFSSNDTISGAAHSLLTGSDSFSGACPPDS